MRGSYTNRSRIFQNAEFEDFDYRVNRSVVGVCSRGWERVEPVVQQAQNCFWWKKFKGEKCLILGEKQYFCWERCFSKQKMTRYAKNVRVNMAPWASNGICVTHATSDC